MSKKKELQLRHFIASGFSFSLLNKGNKFHHPTISDEESFMIEVVLAISIEKLHLFTPVKDSKNRIIIQDIYLSTVLILPHTLSSH